MLIKVGQNDCWTALNGTDRESDCNIETEILKILDIVEQRGLNEHLIRGRLFKDN